MEHFLDVYLVFTTLSLNTLPSLCPFSLAIFCCSERKNVPSFQGVLGLFYLGDFLTAF